MSALGPPVEGVDQEAEPREPTGLPPAGWYPDSAQTGLQGWWTGNSWSDLVRPSSAGTPPGWYPDPVRYAMGRPGPAPGHAWRWWDGRSWSAGVADEVSEDPIGQWQAPLVSAARRRIWPWLVGLLLLGGVLVAVPVVMSVLAKRDVRYTADLTRGHGDFARLDSPGFASTYQPDGYHLVITEPATFAWAGVRSNTKPGDVSVEIAATALQVPPGAAFGPFCGDNARGYALLFDQSGSPQLVGVGLTGSSSNYTTPDSVGDATPATPGHSHLLKLTCSEAGTDPDMGGLLGHPGEVQLEGYVDGVLVIEATGCCGNTTFPFTGIAGRTGDGAPAEWSVTTFTRR